MAPNIDAIKKRLGPELMSFELNPPEKENLSQQMQDHFGHLRTLLDRVPEIGAINLPEIQEEEQKGDRGDRKSSFKSRLTPREYTRKLKKSFECEYIINRVIVQASEASQERWFIDCHNQDEIKSIVLVGGESSDIDYPGPSVTDGNRLIKEYLNQGTTKHGHQLPAPTEFLVGNICISTRRRDDFDEPDRMIKKVKSGCDFFTTQIIAESESPIDLLRDLGQALQERNVQPPAILWSITPFNSEKDVNFLRWLGVRIPDSIEEKILGSEDPAETSLKHHRNLWNDLREAEEQLDVNIPIGLNISPIAIRNLEVSVQLAETLRSIQTAHTALLP
ncbi:MAG: hypothetical protein ABEK50_02705 [bacterium]